MFYTDSLVEHVAAVGILLCFAGWKKSPQSTVPPHSSAHFAHHTSIKKHTCCENCSLLQPKSLGDSAVVTFPPLCALQRSDEARKDKKSRDRDLGKDRDRGHDRDAEERDEAGRSKVKEGEAASSESKMKSKRDRDRSRSPTRR